MFQRLAVLSVGFASFCFYATPTLAKHHKGEAPEPAHHDKSVASSAAKTPGATDDRGNHPEPGDNRGQAGHGKDDKTPHH